MSWAEDAACRGKPPTIFLERQSERQAKEICATCTVKEPCLAEAKRVNAEGVRGGLTEDERGYRPWM